ncbi:MAG TPA: Holliday junction branch migration protein RuvA [Candidatus Stackebrandtia excrementipullorum]|nr:Holliday junction branch migration protein RuvA [Candidatus Stackebrandtia excrementipullorum]
MIAALTGTVTSVGADNAVVTVAGIGYLVKATPATLANLKVGAEASLHTTLIVREESLTLYGFGSTAERDLFELLQTASGVGPRLAQAALAVHSPDVVRHAVATGDRTTLTRIPGVGKKGAERLILELKDKVGPVTSTTRDDSDATSRPPAWREQVSQGLQALGWSAKDAASAITKIDTEGVDEADVPSLLKQAIRLLGRSK